MDNTITILNFLQESVDFYNDISAIHLTDAGYLLNDSFLTRFRIEKQTPFSADSLKQELGETAFCNIFFGDEKMPFYIGNEEIKGRFKVVSKAVQSPIGDYTLYRLEEISSHIGTSMSSDRFLQLVIDNIPQFIFWKDINSVYQGSNQKFAEVGGLASLNDLVGLTDYELAWEKSEADFFRQVDREVMDKGQPMFNIEEPQLQADGKKAWLNTNKIPLRDETGKVIGILGTFEDITERVLQKEQLEKNLKTIQRQKAELEKYISSNSELENFAYVASHDMKAPMRTIASFAQLLKRSLKKDISKNQEEYLKFIISGIQNLTMLIDGLLDYSKVNNQKIKIQTLKVPMMLESILMDLRTSIEEKEATVNVHFDELTLQGDKFKMRQLFQNLINNAIKFRKKDAPPVVDIRVEEKDALYQFSVSDNGIGIKEEFKEKIFMVFKRLNTVNEYEGSGIGLAICKKITSQHQGDIWIESEFGVGTTFYFTIAKELMVL